MVRTPTLFSGNGLVTVKDLSSREDLLIQDTRDGTLTLDSRSIAELWVRAAADEYASRFDLVATLRETSVIVPLVAHLTATDAIKLAEHLAACLQLPAPTQVQDLGLNPGAIPGTPRPAQRAPALGNAGGKP